MIEYKQTNLFGEEEYIEDQDDADLVDNYQDYTLYQNPSPDFSGYFEYKAFDVAGIMVGKWTSKLNCLDMSTSEYNLSSVARTFKTIVKQEEAEKEKNKRNSELAAGTQIFNTKSPRSKNYNSTKSWFDKYYSDDDDDYWVNNYHSSDSYRTYGGGSTYVYTPPKKSTGFLDKLNKSNVLVIHCEDRTTEMLCQIYEGKGWDVLRDGNIDKEELHQLLDSHDTIICLGHGTPSGLINKQGGGFTIGAEEAPLLKGKKLFFIWCYASEYAKKYDLHGFITGNMPSDFYEARMVGYNVGEKYMDDNITYWSKCCADHVEEALNNPVSAAAKIRADYLAVYGDEDKWNEQELGITKYNAERTTAV